MAWRPTQYLLDGELDNTTPGKVTGWMRFVGMDNKVTFDLKGDFHRDIRGTKIRLLGNGRINDSKAAACMAGFAEHQTGKAGDITAGLPPQDYVSYPYVEWYGDVNDRVVIELEAGQVEVIGQPMPARESYPISRQEQDRNMAEYLGKIAQDMNLPVERVMCVSMMRQPNAAQAKPVLPHLDSFLKKDGFVILTRNDGCPSRRGPFEAWAHQGPRDLQTAAPVAFGIGMSIPDALNDLELQLEVAR